MGEREIFNLNVQTSELMRHNWKHSEAKAFSFDVFDTFLLRTCTQEPIWLVLPI